MKLTRISHTLSPSIYMIDATHRDELVKADATLESFPNSSVLSARSNTATPPIQPVKLLLRLL